MATEEINIKVKSDISETTEDAQGLVSEFEVMGVSLNSVKASFAKIIPTAKKMFGSIKAGLISTGIGAFVVIIGSLVSYFTSTKDGAEKLEVALKSVGAAVSVIIDRVSNFGRIVSKVFTGKLSLNEALKETKENFKGVTQEIKEEVKATSQLVKANQKLRDAQRDLNVETAQSVAFIEQQKLIAEDITKSFEEREKAAVKAFSKEKELEDKRIKLAEEAVRLKQQEVDMSESTAEDLDELAELEIQLANIKQEAAGRQISLQNFLNGLREQEKAEKEAEIEAERKAQEEKEKREKEAREKKEKEEEEARKKKEEEDKKAAEREIAIADAVQSAKLNLTKQAFGALGKLAGDNEALSKGVAVAETIFNTQQGIMAAMGATSVADKLLPFPVRLANAAIVGIMGANAIKNIMSAKRTGAGGGGAVAGGGAPAPQMTSGAFDLSGVNAPEPVQAYVVTDDMTNSQNKLETIRRRATI
tara:strand:+ start:379 stop:1803 length:1425 start_codon:yes stop_codon:yes gene_type:complete